MSWKKHHKYYHKILSNKVKYYNREGKEKHGSILFRKDDIAALMWLLQYVMNLEKENSKLREN